MLNTFNCPNLKNPFYENSPASLVRVMVFPTLIIGLLLGIYTGVIWGICMLSNKTCDAGNMVWLSISLVVVALTGKVVQKCWGENGNYSVDPNGGSSDPEGEKQ